MEGRKPKILIWDVEVSTVQLLIHNYGLKNYIKYFNPKDIKRDWILLSVAWKWHGDKHVQCVSVKADNIEDDRGVVDAFYHVLKDADIIIGHNIKAFDVKKFNSKVVEYGYAPLLFNTNQVIDTLQLCRKYFKFSSNKLSYVAHKLGLEAKDESPDWQKILDGNEDELRYMRKYNKQDVIVNEEIYNRIRGWHATHPNLNVINPIKDVQGKEVIACPNCQSTNNWKDGFRISRTGRKQSYQCKDCGSKFVYGKMKKVTESG
jgi:DNA polymerase elongation subunit (family B)